jgi:hypothetical protein
MEKQKRIEAAK